MTTGHEDYLGDLWDLLPTDPTDFIEDTPTEDESEQTPSSEWAFDHKADTDAHHTKFTIAEHDLAARHLLAVLDPLVCSEVEAAILIGLHKDIVDAHHTKFTAANARTAINNIFGADGKADADIDLDGYSLLGADNVVLKSTAAINKTVGAGGDYETLLYAVNSVPKLLAHAATFTLLKGNNFTETISIAQSYAIGAAAKIKFIAEKYYPTAGALPTADGAGVDYLEDVSVFDTNDEYNDCWILVVDGTGTDNGFVRITDTVAATGRVIVASWPGTQPDNTSRYLIVGALIDGGSARSYGIQIVKCFNPLEFHGIGIKDNTVMGVYSDTSLYIKMEHCGLFNIPYSAIYTYNDETFQFYYSGIVQNNTANSGSHGGINSAGTRYCDVRYSGISDNLQRGVYGQRHTYCYLRDNFGDLNGAWGAYAITSAQINIIGIEPSGASGNHSNGVGDGSLAY